MKKILTFLVLSVIIGMPVMSQTDSITTLIFTEWNGGNPNKMYFELTNMGDQDLDLSQFRVSFVPGWDNKWVDWSGDIPKIWSNDPDVWGTRLSGILPAGKSMVFKEVYDSPGGDDPNSEDWRRWSWNHPQFVNAEYFFPVHAAEGGEHEFWNKPELEMWGKDSTDTYQWLCWNWNGKGATVLHYIYPNGDSVLVDQVNLAKKPGSNQLDGPSDVAGITDATDAYILIRKANITTGNTNWDVARGVDMTDSEWIPVYDFQNFDRRRRPYTTIGTHGNFTLADVTSTTITIDNENNTITVPWGVRKGDSILNEFDLGPGKAWVYTEDSLSIADSAYSTVRDGDILQLMAFGNDLQVKDYTINVEDPAQDMALVFPKRRMRYEAMKDPDWNDVIWGGEPYMVTENVPGMDSVSNVPYGTRIDTLYKYLEKAPNASWEVNFVDGLERVDLKHGDILVVTAEDGTTTKEYFISVNEYSRNSEAKLGAITWPEKPYYLENWVQDTIPYFSPSTNNYQVTLPYGTKQVPALIAHPLDLNAKIEQNRATNLMGNQTERTTTFTVTAEDDSTIMVYNILFSVEKPPENIQLFNAEPIISEVVVGKRFYAEIANPGDVPLDLSRYIFVWTQNAATPADAIKRIGSVVDDNWNYKTRFKWGYVPGYKFHDDTATWMANPSQLVFDPLVDPTVDPGDVFVIGNAHKEYPDEKLVSQSDVIMDYGDRWVTALDSNYNTWGLPNEIGGIHNDLQMGMHWKALYLFRIENDSIIDGLKPVNADPEDYTLIDMVGDPAISSWMDMQIGSHLRTGWEVIQSFVRKPEVFHGNPAATTESNINEWISHDKDDEGWNTDMVYDFLGSHSYDPVTAHKSTVTSSFYLVSDGYSSPQNIQGDLASTTVETFMANISKADEGQTLEVKDKTLSDNIATDDTLIVTSANGQNVTKYAITNQPLDDNAVITAVNTPSDIEISIDGQTGIITGLDYGFLLKNAMDSLVIPELARASIIDQNGNLVPLEVMNYDTIEVDTRIGNNIYIEVIAQNGVDMITYKFEPAAESGDAFLISSIYAVDQEARTISGVPLGVIPASFWTNVEVVRGATASIVDKAGFERETGAMNFDDKVVVVSEDETNSTTYYINFLTEENQEVNQAPTIDIAGEFTLEGEKEINLAPTVEDDGLPFGSVLTYAWEVTEGEAANVSIATPEALSTNVTFSELGQYTLMLTASDGERSTSKQVSVTVQAGVGVNDATLDAVKVYPNPAKEELTIDLGNYVSNETSVQIYNLLGECVLDKVMVSDKTIVQLDQLDSGIYFVKIKSGQEIAVHKINILK